MRCTNTLSGSELSGKEKKKLSGYCFNLYSIFIENDILVHSGLDVKCYDYFIINNNNISQIILLKI